MEEEKLSLLKVQMAFQRLLLLLVCGFWKWMHISWHYKRWLVLSGQVWWCAEELSEEQALPEGGRRSAWHCSGHPEFTFKPDMSPGLSMRPPGFFQLLLVFGEMLGGWLGHIYRGRFRLPHSYLVCPYFRVLPTESLGLAFPSHGKPLFSLDRSVFPNLISVCICMSWLPFSRYKQWVKGGF